ncbi:MAG TPA: TetR/AcrR family transcriptional regulator [Caulobacterales bacterium]|nr:TetR/AcrR family transcriptional regulator [Caulobacterales bacterium]
MPARQTRPKAKSSESGIAKAKRRADRSGDGADSPWRGRARASEQSYDERRLVILRTAAQLFWRKGYHETSLDEVCDILEITRPTLYYYAYSKQECLADICANAQKEIIDSIRQARRMPGTGLARLQFLLRRYIEVLTTDFGKCLVLVGRRSLQGEHQKELSSRVEVAEREFLGLFDEAIADGSVEVVNRRVVYEAMIGALNWIAHWYKPDGAISQDELAKLHIAAMTKLLKNK